MADFFSKSVREMTLAEIEPLYAERVPENIRLEYKEKLPDDTTDFKNTIAKELSAFANTYGGYLIIGISTDAKGNPTAMNGVPQMNNLAQRIVSVGYEQIFPPVIPVVSNPIAVGNGKFVYVIYLDISLEAPHFLTHRRGAYVRTSEFSQTFTAELASWEELQLLHNRRHMAMQQREKLHERARERCHIFLAVPGNETPVTVHVAVAPAFPFRRLIELDKIKPAIENASFSISVESGKNLYPAGEHMVVQDSCAFVKPRYYLEGSVWGTSFLAEILYTGTRETSPLRLDQLLSILVQQIKFGSKLLRSCGFDGLVNVKASLLNCHNKNFRWGPYAEIDDVRCREPGEIEYELDRVLHTLMQDYRPACLEIFRAFAFAVGWEGVFAQKNDFLIHLLKQAEEFFSDVQ